MFYVGVVKIKIKTFLKNACENSINKFQVDIDWESNILTFIKMLAKGKKEKSEMVKTRIARIDWYRWDGTVNVNIGLSKF